MNIEHMILHLDPDPEEPEDENSEYFEDQILQEELPDMSDTIDADGHCALMLEIFV